MNTTDSPGWKWNEKRDVYEGLPDRDKKWPISVDELFEWLLASDSQLRMQQHLNRYFESYKGRYFEILRAQSSQRRFEIFDVSAAETLSVTVPPRAVNRLLDKDKTRDDLLDEAFDSLTPGRDALWTCELELLKGDRKGLGASGPLFHLYYLLREYGIGPVTTSKLLAAKFPNVVPIRDSKVSALLGLKPTEDWWLAIRHLLEVDGGRVVSTLGDLEIARNQSETTIVRRLDIILWMEANAREISLRR